jgi:hypothetical protein
MDLADRALSVCFVSFFLETELVNVEVEGTLQV